MAAAAPVAVLFAGIAPLGPGRENRRQKVLATLAVLFASIAPAGAVFIGNGLTANVRTVNSVAPAGPCPGEQNRMAMETRILPAGTERDDSGAEPDKTRPRMPPTARPSRREAL